MYRVELIEIPMAVAHQRHDGVRCVLGVREEEGAGVPAAEMPEFMKRGFDDAPKAVHDPAERIKDQDRDGVAAEVIYTSMGMPLFGLGDAEFRAACFRAFNDG